MTFNLAFPPLLYCVVVCCWYQNSATQSSVSYKTECAATLNSAMFASPQIQLALRWIRFPNDVDLER